MNSVSFFFSLFNSSIKSGQTQFVTPFSKFVYSILFILRQEGVIFGFSVLFENKNKNKKSIRVYVKYYERRPVVKQLIQIYKPGRKVSSSVLALKLACSKFLRSHKINLQTKTSFFIVSSPKGMFTHYEVFRSNIGGNLVCLVVI